MKSICMILAAVASPLAVFASAAYEVQVKGFGEFTVSRDGAERAAYSITYPSAGQHKGGRQLDSHKYMAYATRMRLASSGKKDKLPKTTAYERCVVWIKGDGVELIEYSQLPYFHNGFGLYTHAEVEKAMPRWREMYATGGERVYSFRFVPDPPSDRTLVLLDGSLVGRLKGVSPVVDAKASAKSKSMTIVKKGNVEAEGYILLYCRQPCRFPSAYQGACRCVQDKN